MPRHRLCGLDELQDPGSKGFELEMGEERPVSLLLVRRGELLRAYRNACPHTGAPMEWQPDRFLDLGERHILCGIHGALFRMEDGECLRGPCVGQSLSPLAIELDGGEVFLLVP